MSKQNIISQIYGYAVCLTSVLVFIFNMPDIVESISTLSDPFHSVRASSVLAQSFEEWKINFIKDWSYREYDEGARPKINQAALPDDAMLRRMFDNERANELQSHIHSARTSLFQKGILVILAVIFFVTHWRWVRQFVSPSTQIAG